MFELLVLLFNICTFKKAPQDFPYSVNLLKLVIIADFAVGSLLFSITDHWFIALLKALIAMVATVLFSGLSLFLTKKTARFYQTLASLLGTDALISFFAIPATATISLHQAGMLGFLWLNSLMLWYWFIVGHILRHALDQRFGFSLGLAFLYLLFSSQATSLLDMFIN